MSISIERLASLIQRELANIVNEEVKNSQVGYVNLTEVKVTKDLSYATIFYTVLSDDDDIIKKAQALLEKHTSKIRKRLAEKIRNVRKIPELLFKYFKSSEFKKNKLNIILIGNYNKFLREMVKLNYKFKINKVKNIKEAELRKINFLNVYIKKIKNIDFKHLNNKYISKSFDLIVFINF